MRVLVVSEGKHEQAGALDNLLKKLGAERATLDFGRVSDNRIHAVHGKGRGYFKRALRWLKEAQKRGADALILLIDEDGQRERTTQISEAQNYSRLPLRRAFGVAIWSFDAWMLADEKTLTTVLGCKIDRQPDPESIRDPKRRCAQLLDRSPNRMSQSEMYARLSERLDIDILCERCQRGFKPFATNVRGVFGQER